LGVTRADVARKAGVSPAVVSYVLRPGLRPVAEGTRERVLAAVAELGYRPNAIAQALRAGPTRTVGLLVPNHTNPFFAELAQVVENLAFERGYVMMLGTTEDDAEREAQYLHTFLDRQVDAVLLIAPHAHAELSQMVQAKVPVVVMDRIPEGMEVSIVRTDSLYGAKLGVDHLLSLGHQQIGLIAGPKNLSVSDERIVGWRQAIEGAGIDFDPRLVVHAPFTRDGGEQGMRDLLAGGACTAVLAASDVQAVGALTYARNRGVSVPGDLSVVSFDGTALSAHSAPRLTCVVQPLRQIAELAVDQLMHMIDKPGTKNINVSLKPTLVLGDSSAGPVRA
jgi:LacI family transcriptional regulator